MGSTWSMRDGAASTQCPGGSLRVVAEGTREWRQGIRRRDRDHSCGCLTPTSPQGLTLPPTGRLMTNQEAMSRSGSAEGGYPVMPCRLLSS